MVSSTSNYSNSFFMLVEYRINLLSKLSVHDAGNHEGCVSSFTFDIWQRRRLLFQDTETFLWFILEMVPKNEPHNQTNT